MAASNRFALLGDDEDEDPAAKYNAASTAAPAAPSKSTPKKDVHHAKLPSKPLPPADAVRAERESLAGRGRGRGRGARGRDNLVAGGDSPSDRDRDRDRESSFGSRGGRGGGRGGYYNRSFASDGERSFDGGHGRDRQGRGGGGRGGFYPPDELRTGAVPPEAAASKFEQVVPPPEASQEADKNTEQKKEEEPEDKEMTLDEYEKIVLERRKSIGGHQKAEERKVEADSELRAMQLVDKKNDADVFIKLGSDKDKLKKKDAAERDEKSKKAISINEFLKPAEASPRGGRGRGRGGGIQSPSGARYSAAGGGGGDALSPSINSPQEFPQLGKSLTS